jgi:hypothetical protein
MDRYYGLLLGTLAVWRLTHAVTEEDGPADVLVRLRRALDGSAWATLLDCFYCASVWIALPCAALIGSTVEEKALLWPALSGAACLVQRASNGTRKDVPDDRFNDEGAG